MIAGRVFTYYPFADSSGRFSSSQRFKRFFASSCETTWPSAAARSPRAIPSLIRADSSQLSSWGGMGCTIPRSAFPLKSQKRKPRGRMPLQAHCTRGFRYRESEFPCVSYPWIRFQRISRVRQIRIRSARKRYAHRMCPLCLGHRVGGFQHA